MLQICRKFVWLFFAIFAITCLSSTSRATTVVMLSDNNLILDSRIIITGVVRNVTSAFNETERMAWTYIEIDCDQVLKGDLPGRTIVLKQMGGDFEQFGVHVFGQPRFTQDQRVLLYLKTAPDGTLHVAHGVLGRFGITKDSSGQEVIDRDLSETQIISGQSRTALST